MPTSGEQILEVAERRQGIRYRFGAQGEGLNGLDCSLFTVLTYRDAGFPFAGWIRTAEQIRQACVPIDRSDLRAGDLLFFEHTYEPEGEKGPDGRIASHVGIALDGSARQMWDCHASHDNTDQPGVGITNITPHYWEPLLFDVRRIPGLSDGGEMERIPLGDESGPRFRVTSAGLRLRSAPSTSAQILIRDLGQGAIVTAVDDEVVEQDGNRWRHVRAANGTVGWAAADFLDRLGGDPVVPPPPPPPPSTRFRVSSDALNLRDGPSLASTTLTALARGTVVTEVDGETVEADEIVWRHVRTDGGQEGWMSSRFLERVAD